jgi:RNA polymerase sigma-70 factor (ECF subfamily)
MQSTELNPFREEELVSLIAGSQRRLFAFILTLVRRPNDAEDILQEVNIVLWRKREDYRPKSDFMAWAFKIARNQVMAFRAKQRRQADLFDEPLLTLIATVAEEESALYERREAALRDCIAKLPPHSRDIVIGRYQTKKPVASIAAELGKTAKAISESLRRIRDHLRRCIDHALAVESP